MKEKFRVVFQIACLVAVIAMMETVKTTSAIITSTIEAPRSSGNIVTERLVIVTPSQAR